MDHLTSDLLPARFTYALRFTHPSNPREKNEDTIPLMEKDLTALNVQHQHRQRDAGMSRDTARDRIDIFYDKTRHAPPSF